MPTVTCPECGEQFQVVIPEEMKSQSTDETTAETDAALQGDVASWEREEPTVTYTGTDEKHPDVEQQIKADIRINGRTITVTVKYAPSGDYFKYLCQGLTDAGQKTLNVYDSPDGLYVKNRATPWAEDKNWTYLSPEQLDRRSRIAGLGDVIEDEDGEGGYGILLDQTEQPLFTDETLTDDFVITLTKALLVLKARENPAV
jgi:predicted  nucleic acid-binding Zn-ribbon protein